MSFGATKLLSASGGKAYEIGQSLVFDRGDGAYLVRAAADITDGNHTTFTYSTWFKRVQTGSNDIVFNVRASNGAGVTFMVYIPGSEQALYVFQKDSGGNTLWYLETNRKLRDVGAWYHIVVAVDTTQSTASDRVKIYINGTQETSFTGASSYPDEDLVTPVNDGVDHQIGYNAAASLDGYMAETYLIDGTAQAASAFGKTDAVTNAWIPKKYGGAFGNNGVYLPFAKNARYCVYFDGSTSTGITIADNADFAMGTGNFTVECFFYRNEDAGNLAYLCGTSNSAGADSTGSIQLEIGSDNKPNAYVFYNSGSSYITLNPTTAITDNKWHHLAVVRNSDTFTLYLDGTSVATDSSTSGVTVNDSSAKFGVGVLGEYTAGHWKGWISNFRLVKGTAVYTSNFTPATSPLTAITNTKLLCCQDSTVTTDNSGTSKTLVVTAANTYSQQMAPFDFDWYQDQSGQDNDYQPDNLTVNDVMLDSPTNNFSTLNSLMGNAASGITLTQGNLKAAQASLTSDTAKTYSTIGLISGKWYVEVACSAANVYSGNGVVNASQSSEGFDFSSSTNNVSVFSWGDRVYKNGSQTQSGVANAASSSNILGIALDLDNGTVQLYSNGSTTGSAETLTRNTGDIFVFCNAAESGGYASTSAYEWNFGQNGTHSGTKTAGGNTDGNGIGNFVNSVPSGFLAPCTSNLADPAIKKSTAFFDIVLYTGSGSDRNITSYSFQPDFLWLKSRETAYHHRLIDSVRGSTRSVYSDSNAVELVDDYGTVGSFLSNGFSLRAGTGSNANQNGTNASGDDMVAWAWKVGGTAPSKTYAVKVVSDSGNKYRFDDYGTSAVTLNLQEGGTYTFDQSDSSNATHPLRFSTTSDGSHGGGSEYTTGVTTNGTPGSSGAYTRITVAASAPTLYYYCTAHSGMGGQVNTNSTFGATNLDGSILSVVSENTTSGFSVVTFTGTSGTGTIGHGLSQAPETIWHKNREAVASWTIYHANVASDPATDYLQFNSTNAASDNNTVWNDTAPTSSVFSVGQGSMTSGDDSVAFCFHSVEGFSKFGSYEANGNVNGPFINTGFTPSWVMYKYIDGAGESWWMLDSTRDSINLTTEIVYANLTAAESSIGGSGGVDFLSNGFKIRATNGGINSANTYVYMAFAEFPFKYANAR